MRDGIDRERRDLSGLAGQVASAYAGAELYERVALERERSLAILANVAADRGQDRSRGQRNAAQPRGPGAGGRA